MKPKCHFLFVWMLALISGCKSTTITSTKNQEKKTATEASMSGYRSFLAGGYELMLIRPEEREPFFWMDWDKAYRWKLNGEIQSMKAGSYRDSTIGEVFETSHRGKPIKIILLKKSCGHSYHANGSGNRALFVVQEKTDEVCALALSNSTLQNKWFWIRAGQQQIKQESAPYLFLDIPEKKIKAFTGDEMLTADCMVMGTRLKIGKWKSQPKRNQVSNSNEPNLSQLQQTTIEWFMQENNLVLILPDESHWIFSGAF